MDFKRNNGLELCLLLVDVVEVMISFIYKVDGVIIKEAIVKIEVVVM